MPLTTSEFIEKAQSVHGDRYDYSQSTCRLVTDKAQIVCRKHGPFWQKVHMHLSGQGCQKCGYELTGKRNANSAQSFAEKAREVHGNKYDYSKVIYERNKKPVEIICPDHGSFWQKPNSHVSSGTGCPVCSKLAGHQKHTLEDFIQKAKAVHGDKYDYSESVYEGANAKLKIICPEHGPFWQKAIDHTKGHRCSFCSGRNRTSVQEIIPRPEVTLEEFIRRATAAHGDRYDYSETVYTNSKTPVNIRCRTHGVFYQIPGNHTGNKSGCPKCVKCYIGGNEDYIRRARLRHGDRYDYSKVDYVDARTRVTIGCKIHGDFKQVATDHVRGKGCWECRRIETGLANTLTTEQFIQRARQVHGDLYDYDKVVYVDKKTKVSIICEKHGVFSQKPGNHLKGVGCWICGNSKGETRVAKILDKHGIEHEREYRLPETMTRYRYDFYLPQTRQLIEFHGVQHYAPIGYFGGQEGLEKTRLRDKIKRAQAKAAGYQYLEISHHAFSSLSEEDFEKKLLTAIDKARQKLAMKSSLTSKTR